MYFLCRLLLAQHRHNYKPAEKVSSRMSDTAEPLPSRDAPRYEVSPPPPPLLYSYEGQQPPPYSAAPELCPPPKVEKTCIYQPATGYESFRDICPEASSDTTPLMASSSFDDETVRRAFVRKVFGILTLQLLFVISVVCVFTFSRGEAVLVWAYFSSNIIFIVVAVALSCCESFGWRHPWNIVGLVVATLSLSYMVGTIASVHDTTDVVVTLGATVVVSFAIIAFSAEVRKPGVAKELRFKMLPVYRRHDRCQMTLQFSVWSNVLLILTVDVIMFGFMHLLRHHH
ncbi:protein lifeguard 1 isoform X3 [Cyclopterus lumpus]|uniref:protein lifeguard 1 isoform X3 n=1 Tax=Cyclopterus lumpus TaxID=8103 RepID=UPI0014868D22|nr:protein lifeguard 1 isoform X3 [Cyclopterus lumpus]